MIIDFFLVVFITLIGLYIGWQIMSKSNITDVVISTVALSLLASFTWWSIGTYRGYPTTEPMPAEYNLVWAEVERPNRNDVGRIYLWLYDETFERNFIERILKLDLADKPRLYTIPYTEGNEKKLQKAREERVKGLLAKVKIKSITDNETDLPLLDLEIQIIDPRDLINKN